MSATNSAPSSVPRQARALRTRAALLGAAREVFERRGFGESKISEICERAGVAYGSFYTYFPDKEAVLVELIDGMLADLLAAIRAEPLRGAGPAARIAKANRAYLRAYRDNARLMAVLEQVATFSPRMRSAYTRVWGVFYDRQEQAIRAWQRDGLVPGDVDPRLAAVALATMIGRTAYSWLVLGVATAGGAEEAEDLAVEQLTRLYCRALGLDPPGAEPAVGRKGT